MPKTTGVRMIVNPDEKEQVCREVLSVFPEKLEREKSIEEFAQKCRTMPVWADVDEDVVRGIAVLRETSACAASAISSLVVPVRSTTVTPRAASCFFASAIGVVEES